MQKPDRQTDPWRELPEAARALFEARQDQMLTRVEWERLEVALAAVQPQ